MRKSSFCFSSIIFLSCFIFFRPGFAQDLSNFVQFYLNPALINPALTGIDGKSALYLSYKKQWAGIEGSPTIANVSFQSASSKMVNFGFNVSNDEQGLLSTSSLLMTGGYTISLQNDAMLRFGFSLGAGWNKVDLAALNFGTASGGSDPIMADLLDNNFQLLGNAGLSYHSKSFHVGLSMPNIIQPAYLSKDAFSVEKVNPFESVILHTNYRFYFANDQNVFEPYLIYRYNQSLPSQIEFAGVLHLQHKVWIGGSYKQDFGISGIGGFKPNNQLAIGYGYTLKNTGLNELNRPSHEISVALLFGQRHKNVPFYSFVDTSKPGKHSKVNKAALARQKLKQKELDRKKALAKKNPVKKTDPVVVATKPPAEVVTKPQEETPKPVEQPVTNPPVHDGGPRQGRNNLVFEPTIRDHDEQELIERLEKHKEDADDHHGESHHPNAERHEFVKRGNHNSEMNLADYVIVGAFKSEANAKRYSDGLTQMGFDTSDYGYISERQIWYVHIEATNNLEEARKQRDKYRMMNMFKDAWLLTVH